MNYQAFTNDSLTMMYNCIRGALAARGRPPKSTRRRECAVNCDAIRRD
jgi:hypothetical protein